MKDKQFKIVIKKMTCIHNIGPSIYKKCFFSVFKSIATITVFHIILFQIEVELENFDDFAFSSLTVCIMKITILWGRGLPLSA